MQESRLILVEEASSFTAAGLRRNKYLCVCGNEIETRPSNVTTGHTRSCGCLKVETALARRTHGLTNTRFYGVYHNMMERCYATNTPRKTQWHGARGIKVHPRWHKFENFRDDMFASYLEHRRLNPGRRNTTIERIDNDGDYSPENCRWATAREQVLNRRPHVSRTGQKLTPNQAVNIRHCRGAVPGAELARLYGVTRKVIYDIWSHRTWRILPEAMQ